MSRRSKRRERRDKKRLEKKEKLKQFDNFENVASLKSLYYSAKKASNGVSWKASVQRYLLSILFKISRTRKDLLNGKDVRQGFIEFDLNERGKTRHIKSVHFAERVVQKSICSNALYPVLTHSLIYDNYASQKGKGTHFAEKRLVKFLHEFYRKHGRNGYILLIDFKSYFENIPHEPLKETFRKYFTDERLIKLSDDFVEAFGERGLGLGSETSQINAIAHINYIDHFIKVIEAMRYYGRYMDDNFVLHQSKEHLQKLLNKLEILYEKYGVILNKKKSKIVSLKHSFTFLKTRYFITDKGKIIRKPCQDSITRERRKLKGQGKLYIKGILTKPEVEQSFNSFKGSMLHRNARKTVYALTKLYKELFEKENEYGSKKTI